MASPKLRLRIFTDPFGQEVHNQAVLVGEILWPHLWNFPAWDIGMETIKNAMSRSSFRENGASRWLVLTNVSTDG